LVAVSAALPPFRSRKDAQFERRCAHVRMEEAHARFVAIRWADNEGKRTVRNAAASRSTPTRPASCGKCAACRYQFSVTARDHLRRPQALDPGIHARHRDLCDGAKGHSALQLSRDLDCQYKTRSSLAPNCGRLWAAVVQGAPNSFGHRQRRWYVHRRPSQPENRKRIALTGGSSRNRPASARSWLSPARFWAAPCRSCARESAAIPLIRQHVATGSIIHADEASGWDLLQRLL